MEVLYSSVPETNNSMKRFVIFSLSVITAGLIIWYIKKKMDKEYENSYLHQG